jgi:hypothetical protein
MEQDHPKGRQELHDVPVGVRCEAAVPDGRSPIYLASDNSSFSLRLEIREERCLDGTHVAGWHTLLQEVSCVVFGGPMRSAQQPCPDTCQSALVKMLFDSQIGETRKLVRSQLQSAKGRNHTVKVKCPSSFLPRFPARSLTPHKGIILVGGLGSSPYLYEVLNEEHTRNGINIIQADGEKP